MNNHEYSRVITNIDDFQGVFFVSLDIIDSLDNLAILNSLDIIDSRVTPHIPDSLNTVLRDKPRSETVVREIPRSETAVLKIQILFFFTVL